MEWSLLLARVYLKHSEDSERVSGSPLVGASRHPKRYCEERSHDILSDHLTHSDPMVQQFERWARSRLAEGFSLDEAAQAAGASKRTLARRMEAVMGKSPLSYFQDLRVEHAVHLLKTSNQSIEEIATQVGYSEGVTLRTLLRRHLGHGVREIRRRLDN